jgi:hypothetical protein
MALKLKTKLPTHHDYEYWIVASIFVDKLSPQSVIRVAVYKDKAARDSGAQPHFANELNVQTSLFTGPGPKDQFQRAYQILKDLPDFVGAVDV